MSPAESVSPVLPVRAIRLLPLAMLLASLTAGGCKLIDQRTFDRTADRRPVPTMPAAPPAAPGRPALAVVRFGAPPDSWQPALTGIVRQALARKPDALFRVQTVVPETGGPAAQAAAIDAAVGSGGRSVAQTILDAGASSAQIDMVATTAAIAVAEVRVTVR